MVCVCHKVVCDKDSVTKLCGRWCVAKLRKAPEEEAERRRTGYRTKNQIPTHRCGEKEKTIPLENQTLYKPGPHWFYMRNIYGDPSSEVIRHYFRAGKRLSHFFGKKRYSPNLVTNRKVLQNFVPRNALELLLLPCAEDCGEAGCTEITCRRKLKDQKMCVR